jgi:hypothetical protein
MSVGQQSGPSAQQKEVLRLRKRFHQIQHIEALHAAGKKLDRLQEVKLGGKQVVCEQLKEAEQRASEEARIETQDDRIEQQQELRAEQKPQSSESGCEPSHRQQANIGRERGAKRTKAPVGPTVAADREKEIYAALMEDLKADGEVFDLAFAAISGSVLRCSLHKLGCRVVQFALERASSEASFWLVSGLRGHVMEVLESPHGNFVLQKIIECLPVNHSSFIVEELRGCPQYVGRHRFGCRILCRLLEYANTSPGLSALIDMLLVNAYTLCLHVYANHVMCAVLEHGHTEQKHRVAVALSGNLLCAANHVHGSHVVEAALSQCSTEDRRLLADLLVGAALPSLAQSHFGSYVVRALVRREDETSHKILSQLQTVAVQLSGSQLERLLVAMDMDRRSMTAGFAAGAARAA